MISIGVVLLKHVDLKRIVLDGLIEILVLSGDMDEGKGEETGQAKRNAADGNHRPKESVRRLFDVCSLDSVFHGSVPFQCTQDARFAPAI